MLTQCLYNAGTPSAKKAQLEVIIGVNVLCLLFYIYYLNF